MSTSTDNSIYMQCMEVWGGSSPADHSVSMPGLDAWVLCRPFEQADEGGDVYYVSACATGRITRLLLADVSGHGKVVAETASGLRRLMQQYVNYIDQRAMVRTMNQSFSQLASAGTFATAVVSTFFAPTNDLTLCVAGHPPPMCYRVKTRRWEVLRPDGEQDIGNLPLGIDDIEQWEQFDVRLEVGDLVLCYTDSIIEARDPEGELLGVDGLVTVLNAIAIDEPKQLVNKLIESLTTRSQGELSADDLTVLFFRPNGNAPKAVPWKYKLRAPIQILSAAFQSIRNRKIPIPWPEFSKANLGGMLFRTLNRRGKRR